MNLLSVILVFLNAYPWPMKNNSGNFNGPLTVYATLGDARGDDDPPIVNRFHHGIDIVAPNGTAVYSLVTDTAYTHRSTGDNAHVQVGNYWYIHVKDDATRIQDETYVTGILDSSTPTKIAEVRDYGDPGVTGDHLHFEVGPTNGPFYNPLSHYYNAEGVLTDDSLNNYIDTLLPIVWKPTFWREGCENLPISQRIQIFDELWGKLEIRARARDRQISYRGNPCEYTGIYSLQWILKPKGSPGVEYIHNTLSFDQVQPPNNYLPVTQIYDTTVTRHANSETFYYWLTNPIIEHQVEDRYFNTKLKEGEDWYGHDALINKEAAYKDGWYRVWALGYDIRLNGGDTLHRHGADFIYFLLDNYVPFVDEVAVTKEGETRYNGKWELSGSDMQMDIPHR